MVVVRVSRTSRVARPLLMACINFHRDSLLLTTMRICSIRLPYIH